MLLVSHLGVHPVAVQMWVNKRNLIHLAWRTPLNALPPPKVHKFKFNLPRLASYAAEDVPPAFWSSWEKLSLSQGLAQNVSWISPVALRQAAEARGVRVDETVERLCSMLENGAEIGCVGRGRLPTQSRNAKQVLEHGDIICDVLQDWVSQGIAAGPLSWAEVQDQFGPDYTVNGVTTRPKANGALRIIVDMSGPRDVDTLVPGWLWSPELPGAVNSSIDPERFPARMSSVKLFTRMLYEVGRGAVVCKIDWSDAYKHIKVCDEDIKLQIIQFAGRYFAELKLVFGARSSAGLYDSISDLILILALRQASFPRTLTTKHLDDVLAAGRADPSDPVHKFFKAYLEVAREVGVRLPPVDVDRTKVQSPHTTVTALGLEFDTVAWSVKCPEQKLGRMLHSMRLCLVSGSISAGELASLVGKILDKVFLIEGGRFNLSEILALVVAGAPPEEIVDLSGGAREQLAWWFSRLHSTAWACSIRHPDAKLWPPAGAQEAHSDAAGGSLLNIRAGVGVLMPGGGWSYFPWPAWLQAGLPGPEGAALNAQLQMLELCGPILGMASHPEVCRNKAMVFRLDNMSAVYTWRKGYSNRDKLATTLVKALYDLSRYLNCSVFITKVARCSTVAAAAADCLSKGDWDNFFKLSPASPAGPARIPVTLVKWFSAPRVDLALGSAIAEELRSKGKAVL